MPRYQVTLTVVQVDSALREPPISVPRPVMTAQEFLRWLADQDGAARLRFEVKDDQTQRFRPNTEKGKMRGSVGYYATGKVDVPDTGGS